MLFRILAIITGMMMLSFTLVSCGDDDGRQPDVSIAVGYYDVTYATDPDEAWFRFFDVSKGSATFFLQAFLNDGSPGGRLMVVSSLKASPELS